MARYENMTPIQVTSQIIGENTMQKMRDITLDQNEYYKSIKAWDMPPGTYERDMWEIFKESPEYKRFIEKGGSR